MRCTPSNVTIAHRGSWVRVCPSTMNPARPTSPASPHHQDRNHPGEWLATIATRSRPATVTAVDSPIGPRRRATTTSLSPSASRPPPTRAMRNGNDATIVVAPMTAARTATWRVTAVYRRVAVSGSMPRRHAIEDHHDEPPQAERRQRAGVPAGGQHDGAGADAPGHVAALVERRTGQAVRGRRADAEHRRPAHRVRVGRDDAPRDGVGAVRQTAVERDGDRAVAHRRWCRHHLGGVVQHARRPAGERHRFAVRDHHRVGCSVDDLAVGRRDRE